LPSELIGPPAGAPPIPATPSLPSTPAPPPDEARRRLELARMKRRATALLGAAAALYILAQLLIERWPWLVWVRAAAEAALIGGLADWFAVTALFRHPLGIPIPHTAIIPRRKNRVGRTLGQFVQRNFLAREVITAKLRSARVAEHLLRWISEPQNSRLIARHVVSALARGAQMLRDDDVQDMIDRNLRNRIRATRAAPILGNVLGLVTAGNRHQELLDEAIRLTSRAVTENRDLIRRRIEQESPWWVPEVVDEKIHEKVVNGIENTLREIRDNPQHPLRLRFDAALHRFIDDLKSSPDVQERAERIKEDLLDAEAVRRFSASLWGDTKEALLRYAEEGREYHTIEQALERLGDTVLTDPVLLARMEQAIVDVTLYLVDRYQDEVGDLISRTVEAWDPQITSERIELAIGRDLQFIRINGTVVGAIAGVLIHALGRLL
jgi:uncharacterized membrane-anchored protein YjiN (DUF445 family)